jgi:hypothetical protein
MFQLYPVYKMSFVLYGVYYFDSKLLSVSMRVEPVLPPDLCCVLLLLWSDGLIERAIVAGNGRKYGESSSGDSGGGWVHPIHAEVKSTSGSDPLKPNEASRGRQSTRGRGEKESSAPHTLGVFGSPVH